MPAVSAPAKVLVSGVNGYLGVWIARAFLEHGYTVRGTVRNISKAGSHLKTTFASYGPRFELVEVPDITAAGAFDEALGGIDIVAHTASPFILNIKEPSELIEPAIRGTVGILESIKRCGSSVKRVVLTSSVVAAVKFIFDGPRTFDDTTWNEQSINLVGDKGIDVGSGLVYSASKTLAEKAAWKFVEANKPSWDLVAINPSYVWGPLLQEVTSPETLNASMSLLLGALTGKLPDEQYTSKMLPVPFCDVRDVAEVHVHAAQLPQAGGTRAILRNSAGTPFLQDILDITNSLELETVEKLAKGKPGAVKDSPHPTTINVDQFERTYAYKLRSPEETLRDSLQELTQRGWIQ